MIGISGLIGSGKGTVARVLIERYGFVELSYADAVKDVLSVVFSWPRHMLQGATPESRAWREVEDKWWAEKLGIEGFSPRFAMKNIGTDVMRQHFNENIWVFALERKLAGITSPVVISDCRFPNEIDVVSRHNGIAICVRRGPDPAWFGLAMTANFDNNESIRAAAKQRLAEMSIHPSEYSWVGHKFDATLSNDSSKSDLIESTCQLLGLLGAK